MEERAGQGRGPVGGMRERINSYARHEPSFEPQHSEHGGFDYGPRQDIPFRPHPAPMEGRAGYDRAPGGMDRRASHHAQYEPSFEPPYLGHDRAEYGRGYDPSTRPNAAPMEGRAGYDRVPSSGAGGRIHPYPDREPPFHPQYYAREPVDNRAFRQRRATSGEADWR